jgi:glutamine synthetase
MNFSYSEALITADQVQLYKLLCRQVAAKLDMTASFLPKPVAGVNGSGMHTNMSIAKHGKNLYWDANGDEGLSAFGWEAIDRILNHAQDLCLILNPSVNAYRRLDPNYEAPNQIKTSANDRGAMVRIPTGNERSARIEVRSVAPDANPYAVFYTLIRTVLEGQSGGLTPAQMRTQETTLPDNIYDALDNFTGSAHIDKLLGEVVKNKFADLKRQSADRCARSLGSLVKTPEIQYHHEVTNQVLWKKF